jgi:PAP_fibrillin
MTNMRACCCYVYLLLLAACATSTAFEIPIVGRFFKTSPAKVGETLVQQPQSFVFPVAEKKAQLLTAISYTANGKNASPDVQERVLAMVAELEQNCPVSDTLLSNPSESLALNGTWFLQYTSPSTIGDGNDNFPVRTRLSGTQYILLPGSNLGSDHSGWSVPT